MGRRGAGEGGGRGVVVRTLENRTGIKWHLKQKLIPGGKAVKIPKFLSLMAKKSLQVAKRAGTLQPDRPGFKACPGLELGACHFISPGLNFFICKLGLNTTFLPQLI